MTLQLMRVASALTLVVAGLAIVNIASFDMFILESLGRQQMVIWGAYAANFAIQLLCVWRARVARKAFNYQRTLGFLTFQLILFWLPMLWLFLRSDI